MCAEAAGFTVHVEVLRANEPTAQIMIATMTNSKRAKREREGERYGTISNTCETREAR